jgi:hypothetical protein
MPPFYIFFSKLFEITTPFCKKTQKISQNCQKHRKNTFRQDSIVEGPSGWSDCRISGRVLRTKSKKNFRVGVVWVGVCVGVGG